MANAAQQRAELKLASRGLHNRAVQIATEIDVPWNRFVVVSAKKRVRRAVWIPYKRRYVVIHPTVIMSSPIDATLEDMIRDTFWQDHPETRPPQQDREILLLKSVLDNGFQVPPELPERTCLVCGAEGTHRGLVDFKQFDLCAQHSSAVKQALGRGVWVTKVFTF